MEPRRALSFGYSNNSFHQPLDPFATSVHLIPCAKVIKFNYHQPAQAVLPIQSYQSFELPRCVAPPPVQIAAGNLSVTSDRGSRKIKLITTKKIKQNQRLWTHIQQNPQVISSKSNHIKEKSNLEPAGEASFSQKQVKNHRYTYSIPQHITAEVPSCSIFKSCSDPQRKSAEENNKKIDDDNKQPLNSLSTKQDTPHRHKIFQHSNESQNHLLQIKNFVFPKQSSFNEQIFHVNQKQQIKEPSIQIAGWAISRNFAKNKIVDCQEQTINDSDIPSMILQNWENRSEVNSLRESFFQSSPEQKTSNKT